jgi:hypothetical protein
VPAAIELLDLGVAGSRVLPHRVGFAVKEKGAVAGVFGIDVDLPGNECRPHDVGRPELDLPFDRQPPPFEHRRDQIAEQRPLGVDLGADNDRPRGRGTPLQQRHEAEPEKGGKYLQLRPTPISPSRGRPGSIEATLG